MPLNTDKLRSLIDASGMTLQQVATACGWSRPSSVSDYLAGRKSPSIDTLDKIAAALKCSPRTLLR